jgi:hypothetical protein
VVPAALGCGADERSIPDAGGQPDASPAPLDPVLGDAVVLVPSDALPPEVEPQAANNNLDVIRHAGRVFLVFRTAPSHFASDQTELYVVSREDPGDWRFEGRFHRGTDLREPRFLAIDDRLLLYFAVLGSDSLAFEPQGMMVTEYRAAGDWSEPEWAYQPGFIPWRVKTIDGVAYMTAYEGGENIYESDREPILVHWLTSRDGLTWEPVVSGQPVVLEGGSSETDFVFLDDGSLLAVSRNEAGDELGWGMKICRAQAEELGHWECVGDPRKYDSPLLFRHGGRVFLIGRRNLTDDGRYDLGLDDLPPEMATQRYQMAYWVSAKRCALWEVDPESLEVRFLLDLPTRGDTCFPALLPTGPDSYLVYDYTSPTDGPDVSWVQGQNGPTQIYRVPLEFVPGDGER